MIERLNRVISTKKLYAFKNSAKRDTCFSESRLWTKEWVHISDNVMKLLQHLGCGIAEGAIEDVIRDTGAFRDFGSDAVDYIVDLLGMLAPQRTPRHAGSITH